MIDDCRREQRLQAVGGYLEGFALDAHPLNGKSTALLRVQRPNALDLTERHQAHAYADAGDGPYVPRASAPALTIQGSLPRIMLSASGPCFYESHTHTELCKHAKGSPDEYAAVAARRGLKGMTVTCHSPLPDGINAQVRMRPEELDVYEKLVRDAAAKWRGALDVRLGLESDYAPQFVPRI